MEEDAFPLKPRWQRIRRLLSFGSSLAGAALVGALGWVLTETSLSVGTFGVRQHSPFGWFCTAIGEKLARLSYDLPFLFRVQPEAPDATFIFLDENAAREMKQTGAIWNRELHTQLLRRLTEDRPRAVFFDIVFSDAWGKAGVDEDFAAAMRENGRVFLAGAVERDAGIGFGEGIQIASERVIPPLASLRAAAAGWGSIELQPLDGDYGVRRISPGPEHMATAPWKIAVALGAPLIDTPEARSETRWLNYYGPSGCFESIGVERVLGENRPKPGYFRDRIVVVGRRATLAGLSFGKDDFRNPFSLVGGSFSSGAEVHLTALLNLFHGTWLTRLDARREVWFVIGIGVLAGGVLPRFRPHTAALLAALAIAGIALFAFWLFAGQRVWFAWCVPAFVLLPTALAWAVSTRYFLEERRRIALGNAFGHYLSPQIAARIADSDFNLAPGGTVVEASVLFTDLEGFTPLSEELSQPELVTQILLKYFTQTTAPILENGGMIVNFVGDAVTAVWGAPLPQDDHVRQAARAAWRLHETAHIEVEGHVLRTRVGFHTGRVLAGNVGSAQRFDYAVVGDAVNFASRLEGLNKLLGTNVLLSEAVRQQLGDSFILRQLGQFRVVGKKQPCMIYELLGPSDSQRRLEWCDVFEKGVEAFCAGDLESAARRMNETIKLRGGSDGPAEFYLSQIAALSQSGLPREWQGIVECDKK